MTEALVATFLRVFEVFNFLIFGIGLFCILMTLVYGFWLVFKDIRIGFKDAIATRKKRNE